MPLDFPINPAVGTYYNGYIWDGTVWDSALQPTAPALLTTLPVYATAAARTTALPSPSEGQLSYLNDSNLGQVYDGAVWKGLGGLSNIVPPTVAVSGGTATANTLGTVSFTGATSISLNNVFTSNFASYRLVINLTAVSTSTTLAWRLRAGGTDNVGSVYYTGGLFARISALTGTFSVNGGTSGSVTWVNGQAMAVFDLVNPALAVKTSGYSVAMGSDGSSLLGINAGQSHYVDAAYDGITLLPVTGNITGSITCYGYNS